MSARKNAVGDHGKRAAHRRTRHEHGSEQAAGGSRSEGDNQRGPLGDHHDQEQADGEAGIQYIGNSVVTHAQNSRDEISDDAEAESADGWPPKIVDGKFFKLIFDPVERLAEANRS